MSRTSHLHELLVANTPGDMTAVSNPDSQRARRTSSRSSAAATQQPHDDRQSYGPVCPAKDAASRPDPISLPPIRGLLDRAPIIPEGFPPMQQAPAVCEPMQRASDWTVQSTPCWCQSDSSSSSKIVTRPPTPGLSTLNQPMPTVPPRSPRFRKRFGPQPANPPREDLPYKPRRASEPASPARYRDFPYGPGWS